MKLTTDDFDQAGFSHKRTIASLLLIRHSQSTPSHMKVSYRDMLQLHVEHKYERVIQKLKNLIMRLKGNTSV